MHKQILSLCAAALAFTACGKKDAPAADQSKTPAQAVSAESLLKGEAAPSPEKKEDSPPPAAEPPPPQAAPGPDTSTQPAEDLEASSELGDLTRLLQYFVYKQGRMPKDLNEFFTVLKRQRPNLPPGARLEIDKESQTIVYIKPKTAKK